MEIKFSNEALRSLRRSNKRSLIRQKIDLLATEPASLAANVKKLNGRDGYRLRVQDWRVIFRVENGMVLIDEIAPRGSVYEVKE